MKALFSLFALFTRRKGNPGAVERSKIARYLFSMTSCLVVVSSRSGNAESWQLRLTSGLVQLTSRNHKKILNTKVVDGGNRLVVI